MRYSTPPALIRNNFADVAIAGGTDALTKFTLNGFNTLMILDKHFCKPLDEHREGLNLGEGAGYVVLVSGKVAKGLKRAPYCTISGYNNSNDAYHQNGIFARWDRFLSGHEGGTGKKWAAAIRH